MAINQHRAARRTEEFLEQQNRSTSERVGPGTYSNTHNDVKPPAGETAVPFSSMQEKVLNQNRGTSNITPGPGAFIGIRTAGDEASGLGPTAFKSKTPRMAPTAPGSTVYHEASSERAPGPGTYESVTAQEWTTKLKTELKKPLMPVLEVLDKTVPSIPPQKLHPGQTNETGMGDEVANVCMRHTGERNDLVGPGEYNPQGEHITSRSAATTSFHASKQFRGLWEPSVHVESKVPSRDNPGPGAYDAPTGLAGAQMTQDGQEITPSAPSYQFTSKTPMAYQRDANDDKAVPGPGQYESMSHLEQAITSARTQGLSLGERARFGSAVERIGWTRDVEQPFVDPYNLHHVPGPGYYNAPRGVFPPSDEKKKGDVEKVLPGTKKKLHGVHHPQIITALQETTGPLHAFHSTDDRACNKVAPQSTPAPWQYNKEEARGYSLNSVMRERAKVGNRGIFGTCADRFFGSPFSGKDEGPEKLGDGSEDAIPSGANADPRSMFQSKTQRFRDVPGPQEAFAIKIGNNNTPAPGAYAIEKEPNYRSPFRHPRVEHLSFGASNGRFGDGKDVFEGHGSARTNPGPGDYEEKKVYSRVVGSASKEKDTRKLAKPVGCTTETVGPGSYGADSSTATLMLKKTFNISTGAPVPATSTPRRPRIAPGHGMMG